MRGGILTATVLGAGMSAASDYQDAWGPPTGSELPPIAARDQGGEPRDLASLAGQNGTLLFVVRSADW